MAQTEYTGKDMTLTVATSIALEGITKVTINEEGGPDIEQLDSTRSGHSAYTYMADPLGSKGDPKATLTITLQDSSVSYADNKATKLAAAGGSVAFAAGCTANDNTWTHTAMTLTKRVTKITGAVLSQPAS